MPTHLARRICRVLARSAHHVGLVVGVQADGQRAFWHRGRLPDGYRSLFEIGSITKVFTSTLLADMAREGLVALSDPVQRHLPAAVQMPSRGRAITLEDLATHRSGLPRLPKGLLVPALTRDRHDPYARFDADRLIAAVPVTRPRRAPGGRPAYSNYGMGLLGHVLAFRAGTCYEDLVRARICEPLGLDDTWVETPALDRPRIATGHARRGREAGPWHLAALAGAGGLRSTADDLLGFLDLHARGTGSPLDAAAAETRLRRATWGAVGIGLGWLILPSGHRAPVRRLRHEVLLHEGGTGGFRSFAAVVPATGAAVVVLANQARTVAPLGVRVLRMLTDAA